MDTNQAIRDISKELSTFDQPLYAFSPSDSKESFFVGEAILLAAARILLKSFLDGLIKSFEGKFEDWGEKTGNYITEKIEELFKNDKEKQIIISDDEINEKIKFIEILIKENTQKEVELNAKMTKKVIQDIFIEVGISQKKAKEISNIIKEKGLNLVI